ncbi:response regulator [Desulfoluna spongiiphila]|uniref:histidine kinase n=1 Tax=Desulfoluna spongiiphila TaxID=419481 RepID=A0A1G5J5I6_9BACT|nr:response regulator [Desulfoluna spongiiphila]SCY83623.1 Response regulator receiver domain-containing protein [Desulfoluna spongiiphila]VVS92981.1 consensus disorder prediction [Desulfoluna spongiiphila]
MAETPTYRELEKKIAALEAELDDLREKEISQERNRIFGRVAHEFNNLMMVIQGNISIMLHDTDRDDPSHERLKNMERYIKSGTRLTEKLLNFVEKNVEPEGKSFSLGPPAEEREPSIPPNSARRGMDIYRQASPEKYRVLLVDDETLILDVGGQMLAKIGLDVITAENGASAVELYKREKGTIDLVILDLIMPGIDGIDTYHLLKDIDPGVKVLISSGFRKDQRVETFLTEPNTGFIKKPFSLAHLSDEVRKLLRSPS